MNSLLRRGLALLLSLLALVSAPASRAADSTLPALVRAPSDQAEFRRFVLDSGLKVLLVSDPKFDKSGAALVMPIGQIDDPADREGMAHFLEHMLFLGTAKYPEANAYGNFIQSNGGYSNAYTSSDHTNYQFEVRHEALAEGLDRFAQFFISPLFTPEFTGREINAVHNEAMRHVQNDGRRLFSVCRELYTPGSGESRFSTGNKDTLAGATPAQVRAFYESTYTADRMALAICGKASLDELEKLARDKFSAVPRRTVSIARRTPDFLPRKAALRLAKVEPVKEVRSLQLEFVVPPTRPDFASKPDVLVEELMSYRGAGGLVESLKRDGLINSLSAGIWERTGDYGSLMLTMDLTPAGEKSHLEVITRVFSYLAHLRAAPFPLEFFRDRARIARLDETYRDRGQGAQLATRLANQAAFYPLAIAERATDVWGEPDEAAYRRLLNVLTPDNLLVCLMAKGVPTDRHERIYNVAYSYSEESGAAYARLVNPPVVAFSLPGVNPFMPAATPLQPERPLPLVEEPGLRVFYAADTEFQRPQTALSLRFVPRRSMGKADQIALVQLYDSCLRDHLAPAVNEAGLAGVDISFDLGPEGFRLSASGYGDSALRAARHIADRLLTFTITPDRFASLKDAALRGLRSYPQSEAYLLARDRRDALAREIQFLPGELLAATEQADWAQVQTAGRRFFAGGQLEAVVHGHVAPETAVKELRALRDRIGATAVPASELLRRKHTRVAAGERIVDVGSVSGVNSAFLRDYLLPDESPVTRAAGVLLANFFGDPFFSELRTRQQLGYIVGSNLGGSLRQRYFTFVIQSSGYAPDELQRRAETFIQTLPDLLSRLGENEWRTLVSGARSKLQEKPKSLREKADLFFERAFNYEGEWDRQEATLAALDALTREKAQALLRSVLSGPEVRQRTILLNAPSHAASTATPTFADRGTWKQQRSFD
jgi:insulysin